MSWDQYYQSPKTENWHGRLDTPPASCYFQVVKPLDLAQPNFDHKKTPSFALLGFSCDEGVRRNLGRIGAAEGPDILRSTLAKMPVHTNANIYDAGNITCHDHDLESAQAALAEAVHILHREGITPILIGGGHEIAWGHFQGIARKYTSGNIGILNFDTHFDMRPVLDNRGSSGTPFLQIANYHKEHDRRFDYNCIGIQETGNIKQLFRTAEQHDAKVLMAEEVFTDQPGKSEDFLERMLDDNDYIYLSLCLDVFSAAFAPGVSAPQSFGLAPWQVIPLFRRVAESGKVISYDIAELSPKYDQDMRTAKLAANFVHEIIHHHHHPIAK